MNKLYQIVKMLGSKDYYVRQYALDALRKFDSLLPSCVESLKEFFQAESDQALKCAVIKIFTAKKIAGHSGFFAANTQKCDFIVKNAFMDYIGETVDTASANYLIELFQGERDPKVRSKAVKTLAALKRNGGEVAIDREKIFDFLGDPDARVRANACFIAADLGDVMVRAEFKKMLDDSSFRVNADAAVRLHEAGDGDVAGLVERRLEVSASPAEKASLLYAAGKMGGAVSYETIKKHMRDGDHNVRRNAVMCAAALKARGAVEDLLELYFFEQKQCRENLSVIIGAMRAIDEFDSAMAVLDRLNASGEDCFARATLVKVFAHFAASDMAHYLVSFLDDADERVRANAIEAVCFLRERDAVKNDFVVKNLLVSMCDPSSRVVANAVRALYSCGVVSVISVLREMLLSNVESVRGAARHAVSFFPEGLFVVSA